MSTELTFEDGAEEFVIEAFGKEIDDEGYVVDPETKERETTPSGDEIHQDDFGGVEKGSTIFLDDNFVSIVEHVERRDR